MTLRTALTTARWAIDPLPPSTNRCIKAAGVTDALAHSQTVVKSLNASAEIMSVAAPTLSTWSRKPGFCRVSQLRWITSRKSVLLGASEIVSVRLT